MERTLVVLKPDAVQRAIVGDVITRFERVGLKIVGAKMIVPTQESLDKHYPRERESFVKGIGQRTLEGYKEMGIDPKDQFGHEDPLKIGESVRQWLVDFLKSGPVLALVIEGPHAIEVVRKLVGHTMPQKAAPGTIRGDYSFDSAYLGNINKRPIRNLVHASGNKEEAEFEVGLWFSESEIFDYDTVHQQHMNQ